MFHAVNQSISESVRNSRTHLKIRRKLARGVNWFVLIAVESFKANISTRYKPKPAFFMPGSIISPTHLVHTSLEPWQRQSDGLKIFEIISRFPFPALNVAINVFFSVLRVSPHKVPRNKKARRKFYRKHCFTFRYRYFTMRNEMAILFYDNNRWVSVCGSENCSCEKGRQKTSTEIQPWNFAKY